MTRFPLPAALAAALALGLAIPAAAQTGVYVRGGLSLDWSRDTRSTDRECGATAPPALFGCGIGIDGQPLSASGDFGFPIGLEGGVGYRLAPMFRVEGLLTYRRGTEFEGEANFIGTLPRSRSPAGSTPSRGWPWPISTFRASASPCLPAPWSLSSAWAWA